ncbi:hypothetical protein KJ059_12255 [Myxococcota bacterium]|nr:hypothetical protein [Myxococcota bacterium]MCZ7619648.1 hypothetical protein [Myxococcota bacterium]
MPRKYQTTEPNAPDRRRELRARILAALGAMTGPVRGEQRGLSRALDAADDGRAGLAAQIVLREACR